MPVIEKSIRISFKSSLVLCLIFACITTINTPTVAQEPDLNQEKAIRHTANK
jgi:hypothetical protein